MANAASYVNTVGLTVDRIGDEARLNDWLQRRLDQQRAELLALRPARSTADSGRRWRPTRRWRTRWSRPPANR